jgi:hypothetical protein
MKDWKEFAELIGTVQAYCAYTIYDKYKVKLNLKHENLLDLLSYGCLCVIEREQQGKVPNKDYLMQQISKYCKEKYVAPVQSEDASLDTQVE